MIGYWRIETLIWPHTEWQRTPLPNGLTISTVLRVVGYVSMAKRYRLAVVQAARVLHSTNMVSVHYNYADQNATMPHGKHWRPLLATTRDLYIPTTRPSGRGLEDYSEILKCVFDDRFLARVFESNIRDLSRTKRSDGSGRSFGCCASRVLSAVENWGTPGAVGEVGLSAVSITGGTATATGI